MPGVLADQQRHLGVLEVGPRHAAEHAAGDVELAGLFLRDGAALVAHAQCGAHRAAVQARQVVALATAAVIQQAGTAVAAGQRHRTLGDLAQRGVPVDRLEAAVGAPAHRVGEALRAVLVVVHARGLFAGVTARSGVRVVATHAHQVAAVLAAELHLQAAVVLAQDAGGALPGGMAARAVVAGVGLGCVSRRAVGRRAVHKGSPGFDETGCGLYFLYGNVQAEPP